MFRYTGAAAVGAALMGTVAAPSIVHAEEAKICGPRDVIIERLALRYQEEQSAIGMTGGGSLVELFLSPRGSWTFVHTNTEGISCLLAAGEEWEHVYPATAPEDPAKPS